MLGCFVGAEEAPRAVAKLNVGLSRRALDKFSGSTDVGWALLPVHCELSRPTVANLRLAQRRIGRGNVRGRAFERPLTYADGR